MVDTFQPVLIGILWTCSRTYGSIHVKSTQKMDDPSGFSSNLVRLTHIQSNLATPNIYPIREVFLELWSVESVNFGEILSTLAVP